MNKITVQVGNDTLEIFQLPLDKSDCFKKNERCEPKMWGDHESGKVNPRISRYAGPDDGQIGENKYGNDWNQSDCRVAPNCIVGKDKDGIVRTYQLLPWDMCPWLHGGRANKMGCPGGETARGAADDIEYFNESYRQKVLIAAYVCKTYNIPVHSVICHAEGCTCEVMSNHNDTKDYYGAFGKSPETFRQDIERVLGEWDVPATYIIDNEGEGLSYFSAPRWQDGDRWLGSTAALKPDGTPHEIEVISRIDPVWVHGRVKGTDKEGYWDLMYLNKHELTKYGTPLNKPKISKWLKHLADIARRKKSPLLKGKYARFYEGAYEPAEAVKDIAVPNKQEALEKSLKGIEADFVGTGYKKEYGYYRVRNKYAPGFDPADPYAHGYLTLYKYFDLDEPELVEEHIHNGDIVYPVGELVKEFGESLVPFYCDFVKHSDRGKPHENGIYWLRTKFLEHYDKDGNLIKDAFR